MPKMAVKSKVKESPVKISKKVIYFFGGGKAEGKASMKNLLGGKGANLAEMAGHPSLRLPVPPGFTLTTEICTYYWDNKRSYPKGLTQDVEKNLRKVEEIVGKKFGDPVNPLLVSVRSGARSSMPGMMETILNCGLTEDTIPGLIKLTNNPRFVYDSYRRLIMMYSDVVMEKAAGIEPADDKGIRKQLERIMHDMKTKKGAESDTDLTAEDLKELSGLFKAKVKEVLKKEFPDNHMDQLWGSIGAVFASWMGKRAISYRRIEGIPGEWGTAVNVQAMVYGNTGDDSGSGVAFTRNPANGVDEFYGEFLINAQGEDVVAGVRTPEPVLKLKDEMPKSYAELLKVRSILEKHFKDVQDVEFTIQQGKLFMLQTRNGKRTAAAALKFSIDMVKEKLIDWETAVLRNPADQLDQLLAPIFDVADVKKAKAIATGLPAGPGAASGKIYLNADRAVIAEQKGEKVLLVRNETSPEDLRGMIAAEGILTAKGGVSSHAALVARQMGKVCICGASALDIDYDKKTVTVAGQTFKEGDFLSIDGTSGIVYGGQLKTAPSEIITGMIGGDTVAQGTEKFQSFNQLMKWCSKATRLQVRTNADNPEQTQNAIAFGAQGIGLTRTEHMFFEGDRIDAVREMILADTVEARKEALSKILPYQREDFIGIFEALKGLPATIRLLDPPLHEFVPHDEKSQSALAKKLGITTEKVTARVNALHEFNPMLGHRGCRLGIAYPEITETQARAIFEAAAEAMNEGFKVKPEIMIPYRSCRSCRRAEREEGEAELQRRYHDRSATWCFDG